MKLPVRPASLRQRGRRATTWVLAVGLALGTLQAGSAYGQSTARDRATPAEPRLLQRAADTAQVCEQYVPNPWPTQVGQRQVLLRTMELERARCIENPQFLAALGGLYLDEGDHERALIWLERSLLLDPGNLGAQADHAFALANMGETRALDQLKRSWSRRQDIPPLLRERLFPDQDPVVAPPVKLGRSEFPSWGLQREVSLLAGYESNLDQSPKLTELTLTAPEGTVVLPVISKPRKGWAVLGNAGLQLAYSPAAGDVWRAGVNLTTRSSPAQQGTDWTYAQLAASGVQRWAWLRTHADLSATWVSGPLSEAHRLLRAALAVDVGAAYCRIRLGVDAEQRRQSVTVAFDALSLGMQVLSQCPLPGASAGQWSLVLRTARDRPDNGTRPGGAQSQYLLGLRAVTPVGTRWHLDLSARTSLMQDKTGYSALLGNYAVRHSRQHQISMEGAYRPEAPSLAGAQGVIQLQWVRQSSNLPIFEYDALSLYGGLRWTW